MGQIIYISGPITDNRTGMPREGWEKDFQEAEEKLKGMGFKVLNPMEMAKIVEDDYQSLRENGEILPEAPQLPPRWYYISYCISALTVFVSIDILTKTKTENQLSGLYVIGDPDEIRSSYGTMCEINFALSAGIPVWSQYFNGYQVDNMLRQQTGKPTLAEQSNSLK